jgi:hypothetical protein
VTWSASEIKESRKWVCPICSVRVQYVAGFSAPMNLPGEETVKQRVPVNVLQVNDGRLAFKSVQRSRF